MFYENNFTKAASGCALLVSFMLCYVHFFGFSFNKNWIFHWISVVISLNVRFFQCYFSLKLSAISIIRDGEFVCVVFSVFFSLFFGIQNEKKSYLKVYAHDLRAHLIHTQKKTHTSSRRVGSLAKLNLCMLFETKAKPLPNEN